MKMLATCVTDAQMSGGMVRKTKYFLNLKTFMMLLLNIDFNGYQH